MAVASLALGWAIRSRQKREAEARQRRRIRKVSPTAAETRDLPYRRDPVVTADTAQVEPVEQEDGRLTLKVPVAAEPKAAPLVAEHKAPPLAAERPKPAERTAPPITRTAATAAEPSIAPRKVKVTVSRPITKDAESTEAAPKYRTPKPIGDDRVDACFALSEYDDAEDTRTWESLPEFTEAEQLRHNEDRNGSLVRMSEILQQHPDFAPLYLWTAELLHESGKTDARDVILAKGLVDANAKAEIMASIGDYAAYEGRMAEALTWLIRSASLQLGGGKSSAPQAFRLLAGLCDPYAHLARAKMWMMKEAETRDPERRYRLGGVAKGRLYVLSKAQAEDWMTQAVETLWTFYAPNDMTKGQPLSLQTPQNSPSRAVRHRRPRALR